MKIKVSKSIIITVSIIINICLMVGCSSNSSSAKSIEDNINENEVTVNDTEVNEEEAFNNALEKYSKQASTQEGFEKLKIDLSNKLAKAIEKSGLRVVEKAEEGDFVLSLGNLEWKVEQPDQSLYYAVNEDKENNKAMIDILCVKTYKQSEELVMGDEFLKAIYYIYKELTNTKLSHDDFFNEVVNQFNIGEGIANLPNKENIQVTLEQTEEDERNLILSFRYEIDI